MTNDTHTIDRKGWPPGPWDNEPDRVEWTTAAGLPGLIVRNLSLCGYVAVPPGHPAHGKGYDEVEVDVHGGLTYADACSGSICHVPKPGDPDNVWWFGFDCAHAGDAYPGSRPRLGLFDLGLFGSEMDLGGHGTYRDIAYVRAECERLAAQLA